MNKALYHSELVKMGEVQIKVTSDVLKSKFEGRPNYLYVRINGNERSLNIENERVEGKLMLHKGETLFVKATGSRESADLEILSGGTRAGEVSNNERVEKKSEMGADHRTNPTPAQYFWDVYRANLIEAGATHESLLPIKAIEAMSEYEFARLNQVAAISATIQEFKRD